MITLITALWTDGREWDTALTFAQHADPMLDVQAAITAAFHEWATTPGGREYITANGATWGDTLEIPNAILLRHGITDYSPAFLPVDDANTVVHPTLITPQPMETLCVDQDDDLVALQDLTPPPVPSPSTEEPLPDRARHDDGLCHLSSNTVPPAPPHPA